MLNVYYPVTWSSQYFLKSAGWSGGYTCYQAHQMVLTSDNMLEVTKSHLFYKYRQNTFKKFYNSPEYVKEMKVKKRLLRHLASLLFSKNKQLYCLWSHSSIFSEPQGTSSLIWKLLIQTLMTMAWTVPEVTKHAPQPRGPHAGPGKGIATRSRFQLAIYGHLACWILLEKSTVWSVLL